ALPRRRHRPADLLPCPCGPGGAAPHLGAPRRAGRRFCLNGRAPDAFLAGSHILPRRAMKIGVPKETAEGERRVALIPDVVKSLKKNEKGDVVVESGAGEGAG